VSRRPAGRPETPERLALTAERLIARDGVDGVSLRQVAADAGLRNPASVQYHFGSKEALIRAVVELRLPAINERRLELIRLVDEEGRGHDLRALVEAMIRPLLELGPDSHYVEFLVRVADREDFADAYRSTGAAGLGMAILGARFDEALAHLGPAVRENRRRLATTLMLGALGQHRARVVRGEPEPLPDEEFGRDLIEALLGLLMAPEAPPAS
jgi:AcrR family transcriptional regulator